MNQLDVIDAVETDVKEQFDTIVQNGDVELSWTDIEDQIHEAVNQAIDNQLIYTADTIDIWRSCGMPESPAGEGGIIEQMEAGIYDYIMGDLDIEDMILDYVSDHDTAHICENCAVAVVDNDFSSEGLTATPEQVSAFIGENNPTYWVTYTELFSMCDICSEWGADRVFKVTPKEVRIPKNGQE